MSQLLCPGIEGSNPLGFLAALGAFRLAHLIWPAMNLRIDWQHDRGWRPRLHNVPVGDDNEFCRVLAEHAPWVPLEVFTALGNNLTVPAQDFAPIVRVAAASVTPDDRRAADFAASFGCEVFEDKNRGRIEYTDLCFITGSGHQHFIGTARSLAQTTVDHLHEALFGPWRYNDKGLSFRWDPSDAKEYALRWRDPSVGGASSVWGANRLAFEALPLFPTIPTEKGLRTTGFFTRSRVHEFTWPVWTQPVTFDTVRSLVALRELENEVTDRRMLNAIGIREVFRVQRERIGQSANFKVSFRPARSV